MHQRKISMCPQMWKIFSVHCLSLQFKDFQAWIQGDVKQILWLMDGSSNIVADHHKQKKDKATCHCCINWTKRKIILHSKFSSMKWDKLQQLGKIVGLEIFSITHAKIQRCLPILKQDRYRYKAELTSLLEAKMQNTRRISNLLLLFIHKN